MSSLLDIPNELGSARDWDAFERRVATDVVLAHLLEPSRPQKRSEIRLCLMAAKLDHLKTEAGRDVRRAGIYRAIETEARDSVSTIARRASSVSFKRSLELDAAQQKKSYQSGSLLRPLLGAAMIVHTLIQEKKNGRPVGPEAARQLLVSKYRTNPIFEANDKALKEAWSRNRPIAHLAAALLQYISDRTVWRFEGEERMALRSEIVGFLGHAEFFAKFLLDHREGNSKLRFQIDDLMAIPESLQIAAIEPGLPLSLPPSVLRTRARITGTASLGNRMTD